MKQGVDKSHLLDDCQFAAFKLAIHFHHIEIDSGRYGSVVVVLQVPSPGYIVVYQGKRPDIGFVNQVAGTVINGYLPCFVGREIYEYGFLRMLVSNGIGVNGKIL
jgi:hypothetical protein